MHRYIDNLRPSHFKLIQHAASQIAGRKARRHAPNFKITASERRRGRHSPFKDIADSQQHEVSKWVKEDGHQYVEGGSIGEALQETLHVMHGRLGGGFDLSDLHIDKIGSVMHNLAGSALVQADIAGDDFLHRVGLRHERKYKDAKISDTFREHGRLHKDAYKEMESRGGTKAYEYMKEHSADQYATYKHRKNGKVVVAFRGTSPKEMHNNNDLVDDVHIASGKMKDSSSYNTHKQHVKNMIDKFGSGNVSLSGYSLGGGRAEALTQEKDLRSHLGQTISIAGGASPYDNQLKQKASDLKVSHIYNHSDPVANSKLAHSGINHSVFYGEYDGVKAHMSILDKLAG